MKLFGLFGRFVEWIIYWTVFPFRWLMMKMLYAAGYKYSWQTEDERDVPIVIVPDEVSVEEDEVSEE